MRKIFTICFILLTTSLSYGQLMHWSFNAQTNAPTYNASGTTGSNAVFNGLGIATYPAPGHDGSAYAYMTDGWATSATRDMSKYLEFTVTATGDNIDFSFLEFVVKRDADGPQEIAVYTDVDGYTTPVNTNSVYTLSSSDVYVDINANLNSAIYSDLSSLTIRVYGYDASSATGTLTFDEIAFQPIAVLPVELAYFDAKATVEAVNLNWATYSEFENATYVIERSANGVDFEAIEVIDGAGTTTEYLTYQVIDENPFKGTNYYRLRMIDFFGENTFSDVKTVDFNTLKATVNLFPNPVVDYVTVDFTEIVDASFTIYNLAGQIVRQNSSIAQNQIIIETNDLESGQYSIRIQTTDNQIITKQFVKL